MKAIQIKHMPATETKPMRLKVWAEGQKPVITSIGKYDVNSVDSVELQAAKCFANDLGWLQNGKHDLAIGMLPNGDHCAVIVSSK